MPLQKSPHEGLPGPEPAERWADDLVRAKLAELDPAERMERTQRLIDATRELRLQGLRLCYPGESEGQLRLREAAQRLGRDLMIRAYGWDPEQASG
ncbi:MAG: hypothetical protein IPJ19_11150 [Planctomycetes bacterium]|nr:hypothetical protein [Planctomycetota bacterium]